MIRAAILAALAAALLAPSAGADDKAQKKAKKRGTHVGHMVYFKLKDASPENRQKLVDACKQYLGGQEGVVYFAAGVRAEEFKRDVNDTDWDVALHLVFDGKASHDKYQEHADHKKFIEENKDNWAKVRVFDSEFPASPTKKKAAK